MYKAEPKDVKRKKSSWRISSQTHVALANSLSHDLSGFNRRKREEKGEKESWI